MKLNYSELNVKGKTENERRAGKCTIVWQNGMCPQAKIGGSRRTSRTTDLAKNIDNTKFVFKLPEHRKSPISPAAVPVFQSTGLDSLQPKT